MGPLTVPMPSSWLQCCRMIPDAALSLITAPIIRQRLQLLSGVLGGGLQVSSLTLDPKSLSPKYYILPRLGLPSIAKADGAAAWVGAMRVPDSGNGGLAS